LRRRQRMPEISRFYGIVIKMMGKQNSSEDVSGLNQPTLYIVSGLPGSGKTTLSQLLARHCAAAHVRIDTIEQALRDLCSVNVQGEGYRLAYSVASDILYAGVSVVADSCNPIELTRREWEEVALGAGARYVNIEVICSDAREHRERVESRSSTVVGLRLPTWADVESREYHDWTVERVVLDTSRRSVVECLNELISKLSDDAA
jgi:predicted kinase